MTKSGKVESLNKQNSDAFMTAKERNQETDVIIIGGGAAGMSAALWCAELKLRTLLFEAKKESGGQLLRVYNPIKNHLGIETKDGCELRDVFVKQLEQYNLQMKTDCEIVKADLSNRKIYLKDKGVFSAKAIILATGVRRKTLGVEGEEKFQNKGILESGKRDAEKVKGKRAAIIGGGDAALENALILSETAAQVYLIHRRKEFGARAEFAEKVKLHEKIKILTETTVEKIVGDENLKSIDLRNINSREIQNLSVDALLLRIGVQPNTELFRDELKLDRQGYIEINSSGETSIKNIFAVGDVANPVSPTISTAVGTGATAAKKLFDKINRNLSN